MGNRISLRKHKNNLSEMHEYYEDQIIQGKPIEGDALPIMTPFTIQCDHCGHEIRIFS